MGGSAPLGSPVTIQEMFCDRQGGHSLRGNLSLTSLWVQTAVERCCVVVWSNISEEIRQTMSINEFKKRLK